MLPLKKVAIQGSLEGPLAKLDIELIYANENINSSIECTYEFPLDKDTILANLVAKIGDKEIEAKVKGKEKSKENYEDAIASGNAAVYAERKVDKKETVKIKLGNLLPLEEAKLTMQLIYKVPVKCGSYKFTLPVDFYPNYQKMGDEA